MIKLAFQPWLHKGYASLALVKCQCFYLHFQDIPTKMYLFHTIIKPNDSLWNWHLWTVLVLHKTLISSSKRAKWKLLYALPILESPIHISWWSLLVNPGSTRGMLPWPWSSANVSTCIFKTSLQRCTFFTPPSNPTVLLLGCVIFFPWLTYVVNLGVRGGAKPPLRCADCVAGGSRGGGSPPCPRGLRGAGSPPLRGPGQRPGKKNFGPYIRLGEPTYGFRFMVLDAMVFGPWYWMLRHV